MSKFPPTKLKYTTPGNPVTNEMAVIEWTNPHNFCHKNTAPLQYTKA